MRRATAAPLVDAALRLSDGRQLAYCEWGDPAGAPVVFFHGAPGSRLMAPQPRVTDGLGVRLVTFDRPGYGGSDARDGRELVDTPGDVVQLVDMLGIGRFAVVGVSAGGGHALATSVALGDRVTATALVSAPGPLDEVPGAWDALASHYQPTAKMARIEPGRSIRAMVRTLEPVVADPPMFLGGGTRADRAVGAHPEYGPLLVIDVVEAFRPGALGMAQDLVALWRPWGFAVGDAPAGVWLGHGAEDTRAEPDFRYLQGVLLPASRSRIWPGQGHLAIVPCWGDVLEAVLDPP